MIQFDQRIREKEDCFCTGDNDCFSIIEILEMVLPDGTIVKDPEFDENDEDYRVGFTLEFPGNTIIG